MIEDIKDAVGALISNYEKERHRADDLAARLAVSQSENADYKRQIAELTDKLRKLEIASALSGKDTSDEAKDNINRLVRQIDACIALIEK